ncbi:MAG: hypothetical protein LBF93_11275 [Zoogloeaceae bacterium]|nr:hypothetical protein [Zoogloeaceae bacterium]
MIASDCNPAVKVAGFAMRFPNKDARRFIKFFEFVLKLSVSLTSSDFFTSRKVGVHGYRQEQQKQRHRNCETRVAQGICKNGGAIRATQGKREDANERERNAGHRQAVPQVRVGARKTRASRAARRRPENIGSARARGRQGGDKDSRARR